MIKFIHLLKATAFEHKLVIVVVVVVRYLSEIKRVREEELLVGFRGRFCTNKQTNK